MQDPIRFAIVETWKNVVRDLYNHEPLLQNEEDAQAFHFIQELVLTGWLPSEIEDAIEARKTKVENVLPQLYARWFTRLITDKREQNNEWLSTCFSFSMKHRHPQLVTAFGSIPVSLVLPSSDQEARQQGELISFFQRCIRESALILSNRPLHGVSESEERTAIQTYLRATQLEGEIPVSLAVYYRFYLKYAYNPKLWQPSDYERMRLITALQQWLNSLENPLESIEWMKKCPRYVSHPRSILVEIVRAEESNGDD